MSDATTMAKGKFRIAVVDDQVGNRKGFAQMIGSWPGTLAVVQAANAKEYEEACQREARIHITLVHLELPGRNGFDMLLQINRSQQGTMAMVMAYNLSDEQVAQALRCYACAIVCTTTTEAQLHKILDGLASFGFFRCDRVKEYLARSPVPGPTPDERIAKLTKREIQFLLHYASPPYHKLREVAEKMGRKCVESLRKQVRKRIGCCRQTEMIAFVNENREAIDRRAHQLWWMED
ncbi:MAG: response regulator [Flavobacteriales bacterium]